MSRKSQEIFEEHLLIRQGLWRNGVQFLHNSQSACVPPRGVPCGKGGMILALRCGIPHLVPLVAYPRIGSVARKGSHAEVDACFKKLSDRL